MDTPRHFALLSVFIAVGIALAIGVGVTLTPASDDGPSADSPSSGLDTGQLASDPSDSGAVNHGGAYSRSSRGRRTRAGRDGRSQGVVRLLPPSFADSDGPRSPLDTTGPYVATPHPAYGQLSLEGLLGDQFTDRLKKLEQAFQAAQGQSSGKSGTQQGDLAGQDGSGGAPHRGGPGHTGAGQAQVSATTGPTKSEIHEEGDGQLTIHFQNEDIRKVLELLSAQGNLNILSSPNVQGTVSATLSNVDLETALEAILRSNGYQAKRQGNFVFVGTEADFTLIEQSMDSIGTRIYRPNYASAAELQQLISPLLTTDVGVASVSSPSEVGMNAQPNAAGGDTFAGAEAVVVRDYEAVLAQIDELVAQVDVRPLQIHIEAMILSVALKDTDEYGVNFQFLRDKGNIKFGLGEPAATLADFDFSKGSLKFGFLDSSLGAFLEALETIGDTDVIATPRLMVLNKQPARIQIGDQKGYISTTVTETTATETVEFLETGTILQLRPYISSDGMVRLEVHPELSTGDVKEKGSFTLPEKQVTEVTTNVMVRDGCTVIIGGLMRDEVATTKNQVPWVGNLPLVGFVFRSTTESVQRQEVLVVLTPHIVYDPDPCREGAQAVCEFHRRHQVMKEKNEPFNRTHVARRYLRLARSAWANGDRATALRLAEMAVQFNPTSREAIDLRSDIWLGRRHGDHTLTGPPGGQPVPFNPAAALDGQELSPWLLDQLGEGQVTGPIEPIHPLDPGRPGEKKSINKPRRIQ